MNMLTRNVRSSHCLGPRKKKAEEAAEAKPKFLSKAEKEALKQRRLRAQWAEPVNGEGGVVRWRPCRSQSLRVQARRVRKRMMMRTTGELESSTKSMVGSNRFQPARPLQQLPVLRIRRSSWTAVPAAWRRVPW